MAKIIQFREGQPIIQQGAEDTAAYLVRQGWLQVRRRRSNGQVVTHEIGPGEIIGELGLAGQVPCRTATVTALTDGEMEVIDRGALIRLVNGPGSSLTPLLAALFSRLKSALVDEERDWLLDDTVVMLARIDGANELARQALCNRPRIVSHLPWVFGAWQPPQGVTDLFRDRVQADVRLANAGRVIRERHVAIEEADDGGLQLHLFQHGDFCELDDERIGYGRTDCIVPLPPGRHLLRFGEPAAPYAFTVNVFV
ncbi:MAG: cyclic nucleotide-binding domain-containing protein [Mariprofundaceae bacterium]